MSGRHDTIRNAALLVAVLIAQPVFAQNVNTATPGAVTTQVRRAVVDSLAAQMARFYAVADTGRLIAAHLKQQLATGAYDGLTDAALFAEALSRDMRGINNDQHLSVNVRSAGMMPLPMGMERLPKLNLGAPPPSSPQQLEAARRSNFNIGRIEVLPGNIGYLEFRGFSPLIEARDAVVAALTLLSHTDALIIDVRDHGGGSGNLSNFLISHFTSRDSVHGLDVEIRAAGQREKRWTMSTVPGPRRPDVPVYILTSRGTVSAGEDFAFVMKNIGRATLVGETTLGAGRNNPSFDLGHNFVASISVSIVRDPRSGAEWEGTGVAPHVAVTPRRALAVAHLHALDQLAAHAPSSRQREIELTRAYVAAQNSPVPIDTSRLQRYAGVYGGERVITVEHGQLVYRRTPERIGQDLLALSEREFALGPMGRVTFESAGSDMVLRVTSANGATVVYKRSGPAPAIKALK